MKVKELQYDIEKQVEEKNVEITKQILKHKYEEIQRMKTALERMRDDYEKMLEMNTDMLVEKYANPPKVFNYSGIDDEYHAR